MENNFKCPKTGKEFYISVYKTRFRAEGMLYVDNLGVPLTNEENGEKLVMIERDRGLCTTVLGSEKQQYDKTQDHFRERARIHGKETVKGKEKMIDGFKKKNIGKR